MTIQKGARHRTEQPRVGRWRYAVSALVAGLAAMALAGCGDRKGPASSAPSPTAGSAAADEGGSAAAALFSAIRPEQVQVRPTWACLGIRWHFTGDANRNASANIEYRRAGTEAWRPALPLFLHDYGRTTMFSGSLFRLCPGTEYEIRLTLTDPDGGGTIRTVTARTLDYPRMPSKGVMVQEGGLARAQELAEPGQVMVLAKGTYPAVALTRSGRPGAPIVYRAARTGEVTIEGRLEIRADHVWLHGLTLRDKETAVEGAGNNICITNCDLAAHYGIHTPRGAENWFVADNTIRGDAGGKFSFSGEGVDFGEGRGGGHAVCFNEITDTADGVSYGGGNIDVYGNFIHETVDDAVEPDYARENYRVWENRCCNSMCGFSFQPMKGGPWYFLNNVNVGSYLHALKVKKISGFAVLYGNTIVGANPGTDGIGDVLRGRIENNIWLRTTPGPLTGSAPWRTARAPTVIDYNAYSDPEVFAKIGYQDLAAQQGWDRHSRIVDWRQVFAEPVRPPASRPYYSEKLHGRPLPEDWRFPHSLFVLRPDSDLIDAGTVLPNITGPYLGKAPDLGANEVGLGTAWYGPRYWDLIAETPYGIPQGWNSLTKDDPGKQIFLGIAKAVAILFNDAKTITAEVSLQPAEGEDRWTKLREIVPQEPGAQTPVLEFQDGLLMRLYKRPRGLFLEVGRIEPDGVLRVHIHNREKDAAAALPAMFQLARSFCR